MSPPWACEVSNGPVFLAAPISVAAVFLIAKSISACLLEKPSKHSSNKARRYPVVVLTAVVTLSFVLQGIIYLSNVLTIATACIPEPVTIYVLGSIFVWLVISTNLLENSTTIWHPFAVAAVVETVFEVFLLFEQTLTQTWNIKTFSSVACVLLRILCVACLSILLICLALSDLAAKIRGSTPEAKPLLSPDDQEGESSRTAYDAVSKKQDEDDDDYDEDSEEDEAMFDSNKEARAKARQRLEERGSYLAYLSDFAILIPLVWPKKNRLVQFCLAITLLQILAMRALTVLIPRQLGLLTDALWENPGDGQIPVRLVLVLALYEWLHSGFGLQLISRIAEIPAQQFAHKKISMTAFNHVMNLSMDFHTEKNSGELIAGISQGQGLYDLLDFMFLHLGPMFVDLFVAVFYVTYLFDSYMALIVIATGVLYTWVGAKVTAWSARKRRGFNTAYRDESKVQTEGIINWQTVSHFNRQPYESMRYEEAVDKHNAARWVSTITWTLGYGVQSMITKIGQFAAILLAVYRVSQGRAPVGNFVTLMIYWSSIEGPISLVSFSVQRLAQMLIDCERMLELLRTKPTVQDAPDAKPLVMSAGVVEFSKVNFSYDPRKPTLKDVSFVAPGGKTVALVGETGGGKSTVLKLLYRYYDISGGSITIDGQDLRSVTLDSLRDQFGMVPQDPSLFNISILDNIRYARLDATDEDVHEACRAAAIHDKIVSFPDGYDSKVGERGVKLSGGELQRVAIARAILRESPFVLLDEATSMIDAETESVIQQAFQRLTANRTTFVVAHRLSTIQNADLILVIQDGQIIESGTHSELFAQKGKYNSLWSRQLSKEAAAS